MSEVQKKEFSNAEAKAKISALMDKYELSFTSNAGGGCFRNSARSISIQVSNWYDEDTLKELEAGLLKCESFVRPTPSAEEWQGPYFCGSARKTP